MHYLLYFPGAKLSLGENANEPLARCGLLDLARDKPPTWFEHTAAGPDGGRGLYCTWLRGDSSDAPLAITPTLAWTPSHPVPRGNVQEASLPKGAYWIGRDRQRAVTPADLERSPTIAGYWVELGDGHKWYCPTASFVPHEHGLGDDGNYGRQVAPEFLPFWSKSQAFAETICSKLAELNVLQATRGNKAPKTIEADFDLADAFDFAVEALSFNYRLNAEIATLLKLFKTDAALTGVIKAAIDLRALLDVREQKKNPPSVSIPVG